MLPVELCHCRPHCERFAAQQVALALLAGLATLASQHRPGRLSLQSLRVLSISFTPSLQSDA
jgi:hypothetical protein